ncbi:sensor histidine kinase [Ruminiclostridium cellobioparum]|jgi:two-component system sensor histidine kinase YesM|uniref:sensor histidine kinase n=1 Tax=Ruminiclostridium cellobioparum TaxID=29355 RepID=UPI00047FB10F|nr:sensor histidine kinase [Ruminiclostridium cellobioparum]
MKSIKSKIMIAFIIINITLTSFFSYFAYWVASSIIEKNFIALTDRTISDSLNRIDMFLEKIDKYSLNLILGSEMEKILTKGYGENINYPRLFAEQVQNLTVIEGDLLAIHYFGVDGDVYHYPFTSSINSIRDLNREGLIDAYRIEDSRIHWSGIYPQTYYLSDSQQSLKIFSGIRSFKDSFQPGIKGILLMDVEEDKLYEFIKNISLGKNGQIYIINKEGVIMTSSEREKTSAKIEQPVFDIVNTGDAGYSYIDINGLKNVLIYDTSGRNGWKVAATIPLKDVLYQTGSIKMMAIVVGIVVIALSSTISFLISTKITKPIREMTKLVKVVAKGNLDVKYEARTNDELKDLSDGFNYMTSSLKELIGKVYIEEIQLKQAQLENLNAKINPHFLYNTLDTIYWMLVIAEQNEISNLVVALSDMLRYSISKSGDQVTVREELKQIDNYLYIQKTRFKDRLDVEYEVEEAANDCYIMKLLIQPIVENAIKHGLEFQSQKGLIIIKVYEKEEEIIIQIIDNGKGMSEREVKHLLNRADTSSLKKPGIGLNNVNERIKMFYGAKYGITVESKLGEGTCVNINVPKVSQPGGIVHAEHSNS